MEWFRRHPLAATAAAVVAAVYSYAQYESSSEDAQNEGGPSEEREEDMKPRTGDGAAMKSEEVRESDRMGEKDEPEKSSKPSDLDSQTSSPKSALSSRRSMTRAISWSDENGKPLAQVFPHISSHSSYPEEQHGEQQGDQTGAEAVAQLSISKPPHLVSDQSSSALARSLSTSSSGSEELDLSDEQQTASTNNNNGDASSPGSPQWGWYVTFTPPQQLYESQ